MMNELNCFSYAGLNPETPVKIMELDNPEIMLDEVLDMHVELSHLEMLEVFVGCAVWEEEPEEEEVHVYDVPTTVEGNSLIAEEGENDSEETVAAEDAEMTATAAATTLATAEAEKETPPPQLEAAVEKAKKGSRSRNVSESLPDDVASLAAETPTPSPTPPSTTSVRVSISAQGSVGPSPVEPTNIEYGDFVHRTRMFLQHMGLQIQAVK